MTVFPMAVSAEDRPAAENIITEKAYKNYEYVGQADILITIDEEYPDRCYKDYYWEF